MSEEKLYAIRNNVGKYLTIEHTAPWWDSQVGTAVRSIDVALAWAGKHGGHVVTLVEEPKKVVLSKEQAQIVEDAHDNKFPADYITGNSDHEKLLMEAFVNGYTVEKEKKYRVITPKSWWSDSNVPEYLFHNRGIGYTAFPDGHDTSFTKKQLESYGLDKAPFTKEEVTDDGKD